MASIQATPAAVLAYCEHHTNAEAAVHFGVNERTVRKIKSRAPAVSDRFTSCQIAPAVSPNDTPLTIHIPDDWIARDGTMWKCPRCLDLMPPLPGTTGLEWNAQGCYLHQYTPAAETGNDDPAPALEPDPEPGPALPEPEPPTSGPAPAPLGLPLRPARPTSRRIHPPLYVWIAWGHHHMELVQLGVGIVVVWLLIGVAF